MGKRAAGRIYLRTARSDWTVPDSYVPPGNGLSQGKQPHIASILNEILKKTGESVDTHQVILIDDDLKNIRTASACGHRTVAFPAMPLPGIHMTSPVMEAAGVRVLRRCQLANGAILCISAGSVVDFAAPGFSAIVNAANRGGLGGGGVDGAIASAGGASLLAARKAWPEVSKGVRIPTGECRVTGPGTFGKLKVSYVLHTAGPNYRVMEGIEGSDSLSKGDELLVASYRNTMRCAKEQGIELLGFSLISSGVFRGSRSLRSVLTIAVDTIAQEAYEKLREVHLIAYSQEEARELMEIVSEEAPLISLQRGAGGCDKILKFLDEFEMNSYTK